MKAVAALLVLAACGSDTESGPHAALHVTFGVDPMRTVSSTPTSGTTDSRLMVQAVQGDATVFVSLQWPAPSVIQLDPTRTDAQVWAKLGSEPPRIADRGELELTQSDGTINITIRDAAKATDLMGGKFALEGSITGVKP